MKNIFKEIVIILLLCLAICLILAILFYNYMPINVVVPNKVEAYTTSETVKNEIQEEIVEYPSQKTVFEITDSDLTLYRQTQSYKPGKQDPFESISEGTSNNKTVNANGNNSAATGQSENNKTNSVNENVSNKIEYKDTTLK